MKYIGNFEIYSILLIVFLTNSSISLANMSKYDKAKKSTLIEESFSHKKEVKSDYSLLSSVSNRILYNIFIVRKCLLTFSDWICHQVIKSKIIFPTQFWN